MWGTEHAARLWMVCVCAGLIQWGGVLTFAAPLRHRSHYLGRVLVSGLFFQLIMLPRCRSLRWKNFCRRARPGRP